MCIYLSYNVLFGLIFIVGLIIGAIIHRIVIRPKKSSEPIDYYDGTHGMGYQPLANQGQRPKPPNSELPPLKKPKKGSGNSEWYGPVPLSRQAPPKPPHNPNL